MSRRSWNAGGGALACLVVWVNACGPAPPEETPVGVCATEGAQHMPDEVIQGFRLGDILEPYFGDYSGTLKYGDGETTPFLLKVLPRPSEPYRLSNVYQCSARNLYAYVDTRFVTADGVFDHTIASSLNDKFPDAPSGALPWRVLSFTGFTTGLWGPALTARLPIDLTLYQTVEPAYLLIDLNWSSGSTPESGLITFAGKLQNSGLRNEITVATLTFDAH